MFAIGRCGKSIWSDLRYSGFVTRPGCLRCAMASTACALTLPSLETFRNSAHGIPLALLGFIASARNPAHERGIEAIETHGPFLVSRALPPRRRNDRMPNLRLFIGRRSWPPPISFPPSLSARPALVNIPFILWNAIDYILLSRVYYNSAVNRY